jgi:hypothetical protein
MLVDKEIVVVCRIALQGYFRMRYALFFDEFHITYPQEVAYDR